MVEVTTSWWPLASAAGAAASMVTPKTNIPTRMPSGRRKPMTPSFSLGTGECTASATKRKPTECKSDKFLVSRGPLGTAGSTTGALPSEPQDDESLGRRPFVEEARDGPCPVGCVREHRVGGRRRG